MTEQDLIQGLKERRRDAAEALLDRFQRPLLRYFQVALPDPQAAPDATQEVFLRVIHSLQEKQDLQIESLPSYLFSIARRMVIDQVRQHHRRPPVESLDQPGWTDSDGTPRSLAEHVPDSQPDPREAAARTERARLVTEAIESLDPDLREVTVLHHIEGLSGREVAALLNVEEGTVWSRLHRSLQILRTRLSPSSLKPMTSDLPKSTETRKDP